MSILEALEPPTPLLNFLTISSSEVKFQGMKISVLVQIFLLPFFILTFGCTPKDATKPVLSKKEVNLAIWGDYLSPEVQKGFHPRNRHPN